MKNMVFPFVIAMGMCFAGLGVNVALAQDDQNQSPWGANFSTSFLSDYMFRGFNLYDGASIQPSVATFYNFEHGGALCGNVWAHLSAEGGESASEKFTEIDYTIHYDISFGDLGLSAGHVWYTYPRDSDDIEDSAEIFVSASYDTTLSPTISLYRDYDLFDATYLELGLSHTVDVAALGDGFSFTPYVNFGFADDSEKVYSDDGFVQATFGISLDTKLGDVTFTPNFNVTRESDDLATNEYWFGTTVSYDL